VGAARPARDHCRQGTAYQPRRNGRRPDGCSTVDLDDPRKPNARLARCRRSWPLHGYQAVAIFGPYVELLDRPLFGASRVRRVDQADERGRRSAQAADLPGRDPARTLIFTLTLTHEPNIEWRGEESESAHSVRGNGMTQTPRKPSRFAGPAAQKF